jgi:fatty acid-binding protein DegV
MWKSGLLSGLHTGFHAKFPFSISHKSVTYLAGIDITREHFSDMLKDKARLPIMAHPSLNQIAKVYKAVVDDGYQVISIHPPESVNHTVE